MSDPWVSAAAGVAGAAVSALIAWAALRFAARHPGALVIAVLGGTAARLLLVAVASVLLLWFAQVHRAGYATGLVVAYLAFLAVEILSVARGAPRARPRARGREGC